MAQCIRCGRTLPAFTFGKKICIWCKQHEAAQRGEDVQYQRVIRTPWQRRQSMPMVVTQTLFGINVAVFIGMLLSGASAMSPSGQTLLNWGANFAPYTVGQGQWWRLLSSCFVHIGIIHIGFNMWCLWSLGELAEQLYGRIAFAFIYLLCGIAGSLASVWWHVATLSAGASGAIFGIAGAVIASLKLGEFSSPEALRPVMQSLMAFVGYNLIFGVLGLTDNACHIGGLVAGLVLGALIAKLAPEPRLIPRLAIFVLIAALMAGGSYQLQKARGYSYRLMIQQAE